jgi:transcriptional regulator with XRE-family HTH domain
MTPEDEESLREAREVMERHDPPRDEEEVAEFEAMGQAVTVIREGRGMTRGELAPKCGMTVPELQRIESGTVGERWGDLRRVAQGLGIPLPALLRKFEELDAAEVRRQK